MECCVIEKVYSKIHSKELKETLIRINKMIKILLSNANLLYKIYLKDN
jgi:polyphosphate kinase 2 (PPK2 family)